ncbi:MAG: aldehyde dehydrogenase family protein, partial [Planctomycetota bacterium]
METLRSHVHGAWHAATDGFVPLHDPSTEAEIARASSVGIDFGAALDHAREVGGRALRAMTFAERGEMLIGLSKAIHAHRDELLELSMRDSGVTRKDAKFDIDGATGTLSYYGYLGRELGDRKILFDGEGLALGRSAKFWGRHASVPRQGVAVHINAFNFPAWGFAEKAAQAWLAGMPVVTKPATSTAWVTARCGEIVVESGL